MFLQDLKGFEEPHFEELSQETPPPFVTATLPNVVATIVEEAAKGLAVPVDYAAFAALGTLSCALNGKVVVIPRKDHIEPVQLYLGLCGESGTRKSAAMKLLSEPLRQQLARMDEVVFASNKDRWRRRKVLEDSMRGKKDFDERLSIQRQIDEIEDLPEYGKLLQDVTPEQLAVIMSRQRGRACIFTDESTIVNTITGVTYNKGAPTNIDIFLRGFENSELSVERKQGGSIRLDRASLSMVLGMQPNLCERMAGNDELCSRGLPERFLFFAPEPLRNVSMKDLPEISDDAKNAWSSLVTKLVNLYADNNEPHELHFDANALAYYADCQDRMLNASWDSLGGTRTLAAWARKAAGFIARLAGIFALVESPEGTNVVSHVYVDRAFGLMENYFIPHAKLIFEGPEDLSNPARAILNKVREEVGFHSSEVREALRGQKSFRGKSGKETFEAALEELEKKYYIVRLKPLSEPDKSAGRPSSPSYAVNPALKQKRPEEICPF